MDLSSAELKCQSKPSGSQSGIKGISYNPRPRTWSVDINLNGRVRRVGTFLTQKEAMDAYQEALRQENPDLCQAPEVIERQVERVGEGKEGSLLERWKEGGARGIPRSGFLIVAQEKDQQGHG